MAFENIFTIVQFYTFVQKCKYLIGHSIPYIGVAKKVLTKCVEPPIHNHTESFYNFEFIEDYVKSSPEEQAG